MDSPFTFSEKQFQYTLDDDDDDDDDDSKNLLIGSTE